MRINELLKLTRPFIVLDCETTGLDSRTDRIIELGFQVWEDQGLMAEMKSLIDPGIPIPPATTAIHGISDADMKKCRRCKKLPIEHSTPDDNRIDECLAFQPVLPFLAIASRLVKRFSECDFGGKNVRFDLRFIEAEMYRANALWGYKDARIIDADRLEALGEPRHLSNLYKKHTGKEPVNAHQALADVQMTTAVIEGQLLHYETLPRDLDALHALQWPGWIDTSGKFHFKDGVPCFTNWGKFAGKPMSAADNGYWDFIIRENFTNEVKSIAALAKLKKFPVEAV